MPFTQAVAGELLESRRTAGPARAALRDDACRSARAAAGDVVLAQSVGEPRFRLDVNWDPEAVPAFVHLPACEAHGSTLPIDPLPPPAARALPARVRGRAGAERPQALSELRREHAQAIDDVRRSRAHDAPPLDIE